jgi:broad specificity phosphatase PhoE
MRARETGIHALKQFKPSQIKYIREDPRLREQEFAGSFQTSALPSKEVRDSYSKFFYRWNTGESAADVYDRVSLFIGAMWRDFATGFFQEAIGKDGTVVIFTHGLTMRVFLMR